MPRRVLGEAGSRGLSVWWSLALAVAFAAGCDLERASDTAGRISTLQVQLLEPTNVGTAQSPITATKVKFNVIARDDRGGVWPADLQAKLFLSFGGVLAGSSSGCEYSGEEIVDQPIAVLDLKGGQLLGYETDLPRAFGTSSLWVEESSFGAAGASPVIHFANPTIADVQQPADPKAPNATYCTAFSRKFVIFDRATGSGSLVVSSVFGNAFAVTDTGAATYNSIYVFSFGKPPPEIVPGRLMTSFSGNISKFNGFTEVNFPIFEASKDATDPTLVPAPIALAAKDLRDPDNANQSNIPKLLGAVASVVRVSGTICDIDPPNPSGDTFIANVNSNWRKYNSFTLDGDANGDGTPDGNCQSISNFGVELPAKVVGTLDPAQQTGKKVTITGMLKNASGQNAILVDGKQVECDTNTRCPSGTCVEGICRKNPYNFWTVVVRGADDIPTPPQ